jgi:membrane protease YdiL (CAAX protease family)
MEVPELIVEAPEPSGLICPHCQGTVTVAASYCPHCGARLIISVKKADDPFRTRELLSTIIIFLSVLTIAVLNKVINTDDIFLQNTIFHFLFIAVTLTISIIYFKSLKKLFKFPYAPELVILIVLAGPTFSFLVSASVSGLNSSLFHRHINYMTTYADSAHPLIYMILSVALMPAVCEEIIFRGVIFNNIQKLGGDNQALWITTFLFAILHLNILSLLWLIPFSFVAGWMRLRYNTLIFGILLHFLHNFIVCLVDYHDYYSTL